MTKYRAIPTVLDGFRFDSKAEARRYGELKLLLTAGEITNLCIHPRYKLIVNGMSIGTYTADFRYDDQSGKQVVEDVKSPATITYTFKLKRKLMKAIYDIDVVVVM